MKIDYDENYDVLYIALKDCPSHYVDERVDNDYIDLHCSFKTDEIVGATIWRASEFFKKYFENLDSRRI